jgi:hypothetical protein
MRSCFSLPAIVVFATIGLLAPNAQLAFAQSKTTDANAAQSKPVDDKSSEEQGNTEGESVEIKLLSDSLIMKSPENWKPVAPRSRMVSYEFRAPAMAKESEEDAEAQTARVTVMAAGGSVKANVDRWQGQFIIGDDGKDAEVEEVKMKDKTVYFVDVSGTYKDTMGRPPFAGGAAVKRDNYRLYSAIVEAANGAKIFITMVGDAKIVEKESKMLRAMVEQLDAK